MLPPRERRYMLPEKVLSNRHAMSMVMEIILKSVIILSIQQRTGILIPLQEEFVPESV